MEFFRKVIPGLEEYYRVACVSYDGFDASENTTFISMMDEAKKLEDFIKQNYGGRIFTTYGSSLGGSIVGLLLARNNIYMQHGIIGSSDFDQSNKITARTFTAVMGQIFYKAIGHDISKNKFFTFIMDKKMGAGDDYMKKFMELMADDEEDDYSYIKKESMCNQFYSDLVTPLPEKIEVKGTKVHIFYALKMGEKYRKRYLKHFMNPDIREYNLRHEELILYPERWVKEIVNSCGLN